MADKIRVYELAKENGLKSVTATIYAFNDQSRKMFETVGFKQIDEEVFVYELYPPNYSLLWF